MSSMGKTGGHFDVGTTPSTYTVYADPMDNGSGTTVVGTCLTPACWIMPGPSFNFPTSAVAQAPSGEFILLSEGDEFKSCHLQ